MIILFGRIATTVSLMDANHAFCRDDYKVSPNQTCFFNLIDGLILHAIENEDFFEADVSVGDQSSRAVAMHSLIRLNGLMYKPPV